MVVVFKGESARSGYGLELMILEMRKLAAGGTECVVELVVGVVHLICAEDRFQAGFVEPFVVGDEREEGLSGSGSFLVGEAEQGLYLCPYLWEDRGFLGVFTAEAVNLGAEVVVVVGLWLDE